MSQIHLPARFDEKLKNNQQLDGIIKTTLFNFGEILTDNKLYFFEEYTDHGINHIESVISSSDNLITDKTFHEILSDYDVGYYCLAVVLHDIGMHLNLEGFSRLLNGDFDDIRIDSFDMNTWAELWADYYSEARKFSGKQLKAIFGNEDTIIRNPPLNSPGSITNDDKKLIGEFIRRHHARLAHEIAIKGYPGKSILPFADSLKDDIKYLIGLIARSHGTDLRKCSDHIGEYFSKQNKRVVYNTHAVYLMVLLRNADYLQIENNRTSNTVLKLRTFSSPISVREHEAHIAVDTIDLKYQDDPERIFVSASPQDSGMYLKIKKLLSDIQFEFDISWAVLGELYGAVGPKPEMKYRRVTSNLDDKGFIKKQIYLAGNFSYKANDDIIKLLIAPLYGDNPSYGVRELLQNSLDACKERQSIESRNNNIYEPNIIIEVSKNNNDHHFIISDNGIGMDVDVIKNYFLTAGASFRRSLDWQKQFTDDDGNSNVTRTGRFGVGFLAAFLIGQNVYVETRKINSDVGYVFDSSINDEQINILKSRSLSVGTCIKIKIDKRVLESLDPKKSPSYDVVPWNKWYKLSQSIVKYIYLGQILESAKSIFPDLNAPLPITWSSVKVENFNQVIWHYPSKEIEPEFICNGILIKHAFRGSFLDTGIISRDPSISVIDNNGLLPLALNRDTFSNKLPINESLKLDIYKDFLAYVLITNVSKIHDDYITNLKNQCFNYPGYNREHTWKSYGNQYQFSTDVRNNYYLKCIDGFVINNNYCLKRLGDINLIFIQSENIDYKDVLKIKLGQSYLSYSNSRINAINDYAIEIEPFTYTNAKMNIYDSANIYLKNDKYDFIFDPRKKRVSATLKSIVQKKRIIDDWAHITVNSPNETLLKDEFLTENFTKINFIRENKLFCERDSDKQLTEILSRYLGDEIIIPFDFNERRKKYPLAFDELKPYMKKYLRNTKDKNFSSNVQKEIDF